MSLDAFFAAQLARIDRITNQHVARVRARRPVQAEDADEHLDPEPLPVRAPRPREHVWSLWKNGHRKDCGLYFHGEFYGGWEMRLCEDGFLEFGQRFIFKAAALNMAGVLRHDLQRNGWAGRH